MTITAPTGVITPAAVTTPDRHQPRRSWVGPLVGGVIGLLLLAGLGALLFGPGRGMRTDIARQRGLLVSQLAVTREQLATTQRQLDTTKTQLDITTRQLTITEQQLSIAQQQLRTAEQQLGRTDETIALQRQLLAIAQQTLQQAKEINSKTGRVPVPIS